MFRVFFFTILFLYRAMSGASPHSEVLYDSQCNPSPALLNLLDYFGLGEAKTWPTIVEQTQKQWIRPAGKERWETSPIEDKNPEKSFALFSQLQMVKTIDAQENYYESAVILGAAAPAVRARLNFLKEQWQKGVRFSKIIFLTGNRPLDPKIESNESLLYPKLPLAEGWSAPNKLPKNENEMMKFIFYQMQLPSEWRLMPLEIVDTPTPPGKNRPDTVDTVIHWQKNFVLPKNALFISSQPFVGRQDTNIRQTLGTCLEIETIGSGVNYNQYEQDPLHLTTFLDALARWIFQCTKNSSS